MWTGPKVVSFVRHAVTRQETLMIKTEGLRYARERAVVFLGSPYICL